MHELVIHLRIYKTSNQVEQDIHFILSQNSIQHLQSLFIPFPINKQQNHNFLVFLIIRINSQGLLIRLLS